MLYDFNNAFMALCIVLFIFKHCINPYYFVLIFIETDAIRENLHNSNDEILIFYLKMQWTNQKIQSWKLQHKCNNGYEIKRIQMIYVILVQWEESHKFDHEYIITFNYWIDAVVIMLIRHE